MSDEHQDAESTESTESTLPGDPLRVDGARPYVAPAIAWFHLFTPAECLVLLVLALDKFPDMNLEAKKRGRFKTPHACITRWSGVADVGQALQGLREVREEINLTGYPSPALKLVVSGWKGRTSENKFALPWVYPAGRPYIPIERATPWPTWVAMIPARELRDSPRLVLFMLAVLANPETGAVRISEKRLAKACGRSLNTTRAALRKLTTATEHRSAFVTVLEEHGARTPARYSLAPLVFEKWRGAK